MAKINHPWKFTPVDENYFYRGTGTPVHPMIDNYVYLYHTKTLIAIPTYPESIADTMNVEFSPTTPLSRSAPIFSYNKSGPRSFGISLSLHRDLMNQINIANSNLNVPDLDEEDYVDILVKQLQSMAVPRYAASEKMVNPPIIAVRFGQDIFCKGIVQGAVTVTYSGPILRTDRYAKIDIEFTINEIDPYDADTIASLGSFRGLSTDLERNVWKAASSGNAPTRGSNTSTMIR